MKHHSREISEDCALIVAKRGGRNCQKLIGFIRVRPREIPHSVSVKQMPHLHERRVTLAADYHHVRDAAEMGQIEHSRHMVDRVAGMDELPRNRQIQANNT